MCVYVYGHNISGLSIYLSVYIYIYNTNYCADNIKRFN